MHGIHQRAQRTHDAPGDRQPDQDRERERDHREHRDPHIGIGERALEPLIGEAFALAHAGGQAVHCLRHSPLIAVDGLAQEPRARRKAVGEIRNAEPPRDCAIAECAERAALEVVVGEIHHHRDGVLDRLQVLGNLLGGVAGLGEIEDVGQHDRGGERLARLVERGPDQRVTVLGRIFHDRIEAGHFLRWREHLVLVGRGDGSLHVAQFAKTGDKALGRLLQPFGRAGEDRIDRRAVFQGFEQHVAQLHDLLEEIRIGLREIAMDQVLQAAGLVLQLRQEPLGVAGQPQIVARRGENLRAAQDADREDEYHDGVERRDREDAPADRQGAQEPPGADGRSSLRCNPVQ